MNLHDSELSFIENVSKLVAEAASGRTGASAERLQELDRRLRAPLNVAVVGRVNAGKSTLVNALLRRQIAPTDVSECTRIVSRCRYGSPERVEAVMTDGTRRSVQLEPDGRLPRTLGFESDRVESLDVVLSSEVLRTMTLIDTPGLASANEEVSALTEDLLNLDRRSKGAAASADAIVFVLNQNPRADELQVLNDFRKRSGEYYLMAPTAVGVLTKADQLAERDAAWGAAVSLSTRYADQLRSVLLTVVPLIGLLAETTESAALSEVDATHLSTLAALDEQTRSSMLLSVDRFLQHDSPVPRSARVRLLALLGLYGIEKSIQLIHESVSGAAALRRELAHMSGISSLRQTLAEIFSTRGRTLRSCGALNDLFAACFVGTEDPEYAVLKDIQRRAEALLCSQVPLRLELAAVLSMVDMGELTIPRELTDDLQALNSGEAPPTSHAEMLASWRRYSFATGPRERAIAQTAIRSHVAATELG